LHTFSGQKDLKMEETYYSEIFVTVYQTTTCHSTCQFHNHHKQDTTLLPNTRNTNKEETESHTHKPTKHMGRRDTYTLTHTTHTHKYYN
jgi:hypothetical protein